jgi:hypothetical protein
MDPNGLMASLILSGYSFTLFLYCKDKKLPVLAYFQCYIQNLNNFDMGPVWMVG